MDGNYSLGDIASVCGGNDNGCNSWVLILLFAMIFGNGGFGGFGNGNANRFATADDVQRSTDFSALERQNNEGVAATRQTAYDIMGAVKDMGYNNLSETRSLEQTVVNGFAESQKCCCETNRNIDNVKYELSTAIHAEGEATRSMMQADRIAELQSQLNNLQIQNAMCGVVRYPSSTTFAINPPMSPMMPYCGGGNV